MTLKIAAYYPYLYLRSGIERTILEILKRSSCDWTVFTNRYEPETTYPEFDHYRDKIVELKRISVSRSYINTLRAAHAIMKQRLPLDGFDVLWVHNEGLGSFINFKNANIPSICFCHTPLKIIYDERLREAYLRENILKAPLFFLFSSLFRHIDRKAFRLYDWCFCVSREVETRVLKNRLFPQATLEVVYRGVDTTLFKGNAVYGNYFFHPARIKWWKNIELSIEAFCLFQKLHSEFRDFRLLIAGDLYAGNQSYFKKLMKLAHRNPCIEFIIGPKESQIVDLYQNCRGVLSTTLNEDFGLTVLEGFSFAKPVIAVNRGGPTEIIRHAQTGFLSPEDKNEYATHMYSLAKDKGLAKEMGEKGRQDILKYDWDNFIFHLDTFLENFVRNDRERKT